MRLFIENIPSVRGCRWGSSGTQRSRKVLKDFRPFYQLNSRLFAFKNERTAKIFSNQ